MSFQKPEILWALVLLAPYAALEYFLLTRGRPWVRRLSPGAESAASIHSWTRRRAARILSGGWTWALAVAALAGPSWGVMSYAGLSSGVQAALVLDVSNSMLSTDIHPSRLDAARDTARALVRMRPEVPYSVIVFKGGATLLCPPTDDPDALDQALDWAVPEVLSAHGTAIASGLKTALAEFSSDPNLAKYIVLFSDGDDLAGGAERAAREAREAGVRILAVGCGGTDEVPARDPAGAAVKLADGAPARTALRTAFLRRWAEEAEGAYLDASDPSTLRNLADALDGRPGAPGSRALPKPADRTGLFALLALLGVIARAAAALPVPPKGRRKTKGRAAASLLVVLTLSGCSGPRISVLRGNRMTRHGRYEEAVASYLAAGTQAGDGLVALNLGGVYSRMGELSAAEPLYEQARESRDVRVAAAAHHNMGVQLFEAYRFEEAAESFKQALRLAPGNLETKRALELSQSVVTAAASPMRRQNITVKPGGRDEALLSLLRRMESDWFRPSQGTAEDEGGLDH